MKRSSRGDGAAIRGGGGAILAPAQTGTLNLMPRATTASETGLPRAGEILTQVFGVAATSYWLLFFIQWAPSFAESSLGTAIPAPLPSSLGEALAAFARHAILPGVFEEVLFRGILFAILIRARGSRFAIIVSALFFGAAHGDLHHALVATALGLQLGLVRAIHGLPVAIAAHVFNNTLALWSNSISPRLPASVFPALEPERLLLVVFALILSGIACAALVQGERSQEPPADAGRSGL